MRLNTAMTTLAIARQLLARSGIRPDSYRDYYDYRGVRMDLIRIAAALAGRSAAGMRRTLLAATPESAGEDGQYYAAYRRGLARFQSVDALVDGLADVIMWDGGHAGHWVGAAWADAIEAVAAAPIAH